MAYDCHSIPADCAKVALDEERGLVKVRSVVSKMATQWKNFKTAMKEGRTGKPKAPSHDIAHLNMTINWVHKIWPLSSEMSFWLPFLWTNTTSFKTLGIQVIYDTLHGSVDHVSWYVQFMLLSSPFLHGPVSQKFPRSVHLFCNGLPHIVNCYVLVACENSHPSLLPDQMTFREKVLLRPLGPGAKKDDCFRRLTSLSL